jgi:hypothetical protein
MKILKPREDVAHIPVRVVHRSHGFLDGFESVFREIDDLRGMSFFQQLLHGIDRFFDPMRIVVGASVVDESVRFHGVIDGAPIGGRVEFLGAFLRRLDEQALAEAVVFHPAVYEHLDQRILVLS